MSPKPGDGTEGGDMDGKKQNLDGVPSMTHMALMAPKNLLDKNGPKLPATW